MSVALENFRAAPVHEIALGGVPLRYRVFGDGPAVLFVHGWPLSGVTYRYLIDALRPHYRCYVPDLPGAGDTPWSSRIHETLRGYTDLLHAFVEHLQLDRVALIGHDSGGGVARLLAAKLAARVTCLLLQNTELPGHTPPAVKRLKLVCRYPGASRALSALVANRALRRSALVGFGGCFGDLQLLDGEFFETSLAPLIRDAEGQRSSLAHLDLTWTNHLNDVHGRIEAPIHLFWGEQDRFFPLSGAREMAKSFKQGGELKVIPGAKLYVHEEAPAELAAFSLAMLDGAAAAAAGFQAAPRGIERPSNLQS